MEEPVARIEIHVHYDTMHAVHDVAAKTLRVSGDATVRGGGFSLMLVPGEPRGINDEMLVLHLTITPTGESPQDQPLDYEQPWDDDGIQYTEVEIVVVGDVMAAAPPILPIESA
jgi:hypothetical protein